MDHQSPEKDATSPQEELLSAVAVVSRMKEVAGLKADMHLASELGTTRANIAKWKARNSVPYHEAVKVALRFGGSLDYILLGLDPVPETKETNIFLLESMLIRGVLQTYADRGVISEEPGSPTPLNTEVQLMANVLTMQHTKFLRATSELQKIRGLTRQDALRQALADMGIKAMSLEGPQ